MQHECAFARRRRTLVRCAAYADERVALRERGQDIAQPVRSGHRIELVDVGQSRRRRDVVVGAEGHHQVVAIVRAGIGGHATGRRVDGGHRFAQQAHAGLDEVAIRMAHRVERGVAEHHVELGEAEDERVALVDQRHLHLIAQRLRQDRAQLHAGKAGAQDRDPRAHVCCTPSGM